MRGYWFKIVAGALGIFLVGITAVSLAKTGERRVRHVVESAEPITIPLAFIPFNLDGVRAGSIRRLTILRSEPKVVTGFRIRVEVADLATYTALSGGCVMTVGNPTQLSPSTNFRCGPVDTSQVEFGRVEVVLAEGTNTRLDIPLHLPAELVAEFRRSGEASAASGLAEGVAAGAGGEGGAGGGAAAIGDPDLIAVNVRRMADSIRRETRLMADSIRREAQRTTVRP